MADDHKITVGQIVNHLSANEPVKILKIQPLGSMISISFVGVHSKISNSRVLTKEEFGKLHVEAKDTREKIDIVELNKEIATTVGKIDKLLTSIDEIVKEIGL